MKYLLIAFLACFFVGNAAARGQRLSEFSAEVNQLVMQRASQMSEPQRRQIWQLLQQIQSVAVADGSIAPVMPGPPTGLIVTPPLPPPAAAPAVMCSDDAPDRQSLAVAKIREFAYAGNGLNLPNSRASQYLAAWIQRYPCREANHFAREGYKIFQAASSGNGLNMPYSKASQFTEEMLERRCYPDVDYAEEAIKYFTLASSGNGLNMPYSQASNYAREQMEKRYFSCRR